MFTDPIDQTYKSRYKFTFKAPTNWIKASLKKCFDVIPQLTLQPSY